MFDSCDICGAVSHDLTLVSDGTDSGVLDLMCPACMEGRFSESSCTYTYEVEVEDDD